MAGPKVTETSTITNTFFASLGDKEKVRVAGVIKAISDKETASGQAKRFKGEIAVQHKDDIYTARYGFFPTAIRDGLISAAGKLGKWSSFEFVLTGVKSSPENGSPSWSITFDIAPRIEKPRALALLDS